MAVEFNHLMKEFNETFETSSEDSYFIISKKLVIYIWLLTFDRWLDEWKVYISYEDIMKGLHPFPYSQRPGPINDNLKDREREKDYYFNYDSKK